MLKNNINVRKIAEEFMKKSFEDSKEDAEVDFRLKYCNLIYTEANKYSVLSRMILDFDDDGLYEIKGIDYLCGVYFYVVKAIDNRHEHAHELLREFKKKLAGVRKGLSESTLTVYTNNMHRVATKFAGLEKIPETGAWLNKKELHKKIK